MSSCIDLLLSYQLLRERGEDWMDSRSNTKSINISTCHNSTDSSDTFEGVNVLWIPSPPCTVRGANPPHIPTCCDPLSDEVHVFQSWATAKQSWHAPTGEERKMHLQSELPDDKSQMDTLLHYIPYTVNKTKWCLTMISGVSVSHSLQSDSSHLTTFSYIVSSSYGLLPAVTSTQSCINNSIIIHSSASSGRRWMDG